MAATTLLEFAITLGASSGIVEARHSIDENNLSRECRQPLGIAGFRLVETETQFPYVIPWRQSCSKLGAPSGKRDAVQKTAGLERFSGTSRRLEDASTSSPDIVG
jgi:hypothetical protein